MDDPTNKSIFPPLDKSKAEIRLLHLQPRVVAGDKITCTLRLADLDTKDCEYEALSYEWGLETDTIFTAVINEEEVTIRENLWWALWYLRAEEGERVIWIDALCINQTSELERNHQVCHFIKLHIRSEVNSS